jgi:hypothetical protein
MSIGGMQRIKCKALQAIAAIFGIRCIRSRMSAVCVWRFCYNLTREAEPRQAVRF